MGINSNSDFSDTFDNAIWDELTVGTTAVEAIVGGSILVGRQMLLILNDSSTNIFYGFDNTVTTSGFTRGFKLIKNAKVTININDCQDVFLISGSAGTKILIAEFS